MKYGKRPTEQIFESGGRKKKKELVKKKANKRKPLWKKISRPPDRNQTRSNKKGGKWSQRRVKAAESGAHQTSY